MIANQFEAIMKLDLAPIKAKLMHVESGEGWSREKADAVEKEYRRFLCLMKAYPDEATAPLVDVDTFWHYHILDTMKYAVDCQQAFGYFLHHYPYVGMHEGDQRHRLDSGNRMRDLYELTFGEAYQWASTWCAEPAAKDAVQACGSATARCAAPTAKDTRHTCGSVTAWCAAPTVQDQAWRRHTALPHPSEECVPLSAFA